MNDRCNDDTVLLVLCLHTNMNIFKYYQAGNKKYFRTCDSGMWHYLKFLYSNFHAMQNSEVVPKFSANLSTKRKM